MRVLLVYDIPDDAKRAKIADVCLDYGLERIQYSAFTGNLAATYQGELSLKNYPQGSARSGNIQFSRFARMTGLKGGSFYRRRSHANHRPKNRNQAGYTLLRDRSEAVGLLPAGVVLFIVPAGRPPDHL